eukprot:scaffold3031_cov285-Pinguiococcus_pyrenoidosus.AAC.7
MAKSSMAQPLARLLRKSSCKSLRLQSNAWVTSATKITTKTISAARRLGSVSYSPGNPVETSSHCSSVRLKRLTTTSLGSRTLKKPSRYFQVFMVGTQRFKPPKSARKIPRSDR